MFFHATTIRASSNHSFSIGAILGSKLLTHWAEKKFPYYKVSSKKSFLRSFCSVKDPSKGPFSNWSTIYVINIILANHNKMNVIKLNDLFLIGFFKFASLPF